ncbi:MAG: bifunctional phosphoribosyl-AMP cyclohydrolase/phosphoribosyl-ATP diphosphatase HisIE [Flavobacteriaceae bacterium]
MKIEFEKSADGLVPAIIQDAATKNVLMLGYMNREALDKTRQTGRVTFYSRSKNRLWTKGEESGNFLIFQEVLVDCDQDSLLISAIPAGPTCHKGSDTCWNQNNVTTYGFISKLESIIEDRKRDQEQESSYVASLFRAGINKIAQKVGEEAVETVIEAKDNDTDKFLNETADLVFHLLVLLRAKNQSFAEVVKLLEKRHES